MWDGPQQLRQHDLAGAEHGADRQRLETDVQHRQGQKVITLIVNGSLVPTESKVSPPQEEAASK